VKRLSRLQIKHFDGMTRLEVLETLHDQKKQLGMIALSFTSAGEDKRLELEARIEYLEKRLKQL
jgi:hypothetical protein